MSPHLVRDISAHKESLALLGGEVEKQIEEGIRAFVERDGELAMRVIKADTEIDRKEVEIEEDILKSLALYQPRAQDLRFMISALKVNIELERIAEDVICLAEGYIARHTRPELA